MNDFILDQNSFPADPLCLLAPDGMVVRKDLLEKLTTEQLVSFYEWMLKIRIADKRAINLQRTGKMGTYPSVYGQEACQVGVGLAMDKEDWLVPTFRETGTMWAHGVPLKDTFLYWMGSEQGSCMPQDVNCLPIAITVGGHLPHGVGIAWANKCQGKSGAVVVSFGDGATSEGDFHSALNFAAVLKVPVVFFCQNNSYAISTPLAYQTASKTFAQKAFAYGAKGILVDGNDVAATYLAVKEALRTAKEEQCPVLIEGVTYRLGDHTTVDNSKLYRAEDEVTQMLAREPLRRLKLYLEGIGAWSEQKETEFTAMVEQEVETIVNEALVTPALDPRKMFTRLYEEMPPIIQKQHDEFSENLQSDSISHD